MKLANAILAAAVAATIAAVGYSFAQGESTSDQMTPSAMSSASSGAAAAANCPADSTTPIMIDGRVQCEVLQSATGAHCTGQQVLVLHDGKEMCAAGTVEQIPGVTADTSANATDQSSVSGTMPDDGAAVPDMQAGDSALGTPHCDTGTLVTLNGVALCKQKTRLVCDKHRLHQFVPPGAYDVRWDGTDCKWHFHLAEQ
ncbi:MAG TPA: hypothetical protein VFL98_01355 [Candidatus Paceibacterota bacterium]|nr:hypothetical protein [Candidatus Paceibacterota bacterium]